MATKAIWVMTLAAASLLMCVTFRCYQRLVACQPSLARARETSDRVACVHNLQRLGQLLDLYARQNGDEYPASLDNLPLPDGISSAIFVCPSSPEGRALGSSPARVTGKLTMGVNLSYVYAGAGVPASTHGDTLLLYEPPSKHSDATSNFLFAGCRVESFDAEKARKLIDALRARDDGPRLPEAGN